MRVAVLGPGGVGGLVAGALHRSGTEVVVVAREQTAELISDRGLHVRSVGLGEFTATYFLATPAFTTIPVALYHFAATRASGVADALAGLLVGIAFAAFLVVQRGGSRVAF